MSAWLHALQTRWVLTKRNHVSVHRLGLFVNGKDTSSEYVSVGVVGAMRGFDHGECRWAEVRDTYILYMYLFDWHLSDYAACKMGRNWKYEGKQEETLKSIQQMLQFILALVWILNALVSLDSIRYSTRAVCFLQTPVSDR